MYVKPRISFEPIGLIHTPFKNLKGMPIQPEGAAGVRGQIEIFPEYQEGLKDLEGFSHIYLIFYFHKVNDCKLRVIPFLDTKLRGVFATRAPIRPNAIGLSIVQLLEIKENIIEITNVDMLNGTPLLDIKPYIPQTDPQKVIKLGWLEGKINRFRKRTSDGRFLNEIKNDSDCLDE